MKKLMIAAAALLLSAHLFAQEKNFIDQPYLEVNGRAEMEVAPDEIYVRITINEQDSKGKVTVLQQEKDMVRRLKDLGIDVEKKLVVQDMSSDLFKRKDVSTSKTYQLEVNSATQLAHVFQALQAVGISDASIERTDVSNMDELRQQVRAAAAKDAQQNAQVLASALGQKAGKALFVQDYSYSARPYANIMMAKSAVMDMAAEATAAPTLEFEKIKIEHSVMVRFVLE